jgi:ribonuclease HI
VVDTRVVDELIGQLGLTACDAVLIGDGSGTLNSTPAGWCVLVRCRSRFTHVEKLEGTLSHGTNNLAELCPFLHGLWWLESLGLSRGTIGIVTDSEYCKKIGSGENSLKSNRTVWEAYRCFCRLGYVIRWVWLPRDTHPAHRLVDERSRTARLMITAYLEGRG